MLPHPSPQVFHGVLHETDVAVKVLFQSGLPVGCREALSLSSPLLDELKKEGGLLAALRHPNIVQVQEGLLVWWAGLGSKAAHSENGP